MRIEHVELHSLRISLRHAFAHAAGTRRTSELVLVAVRDELGGVGWGEIAPREYVTGETVASVMGEHGPTLARALVGREVASLVDVIAWIHDRAREVGDAVATLAGFDLALLDLAGKRFGVAVADLIGGVRRRSLPAGVVVGFEVGTAALARHCARLRWAGRRHVKVKVGLDDDRERLEIVARALPGIALRLDANMAWTADQARERLRALAGLPIHSIEQPVARRDLDGMRRVREVMPVMADESVCTLADLERAIEARALDHVNVRLGKMGGVLATRRICERARSAGVGLQLGTMVGETGILSRASELLGRCVDGFDCLDGRGQNSFLLDADVLAEAAPERESSTTGDLAAGLGVEVAIERVRALSVVEPTVFAA